MTFGTTVDGIAGDRVGVVIARTARGSMQAAAAARNLVGRAERYDPVPFFWSDQYDVKIQVHGLIESSSVTRVLHGDLEADRFVIGYFDAQDTLRAVLGWNATREVRRLRAGIGAHAMGPMGTDDGSRVTSS